MKKNVLIFSARQDAHATKVVEHLEKLDASVDFMGFEMLSSPAKWNFGFAQSDSTRALETPDKRFDFNSYDSIWYRRPGKLKPTAFPEPWLTQFTEYETKAAWTGILLSTRALWVNHPSRDRDCLHKLWQLDVAAKVGLQIPDTVVTTDPQVVREFFEKCRGKVIYKLISESSSFAFPTFETVGVPTTPFIEADLQHIDQVVHCPHIFQRMIEKTADVRITVIGKEVFAGRIHSQTGTGKLDWRQDYSVKMEPMTVPDDVEKKCLDLVRKLRLNYGTMDFCETADGELIFLEINCAGQYLWLEYKTGQPMSKQMAMLLAQKSEALVEDAFA